MSKIACMIGWDVTPEITTQEMCAQLRERANKIESGEMALSEVVSICTVSMEGDAAVLTPCFGDGAKP